MVMEEGAAHPGVVVPFVGVHPSEARSGLDFTWLRGSLEGAAGLGEVGLDPKYSEVGPKGPQLACFRAQVEAASKLRKPLQVHSRGAERACFDLLGEYDLEAVLMHWFQDEESAPVVFERGYYVSFGPSLLYSKKTQRIARKAGEPLSLAESDSPVPFAPLGGTHGPSLVPSIAFKLAEIWKTSFEEAAETLAENAERFSGVHEKG